MTFGKGFKPKVVCDAVLRKPKYGFLKVAWLAS